MEFSNQVIISNPKIKTSKSTDEFHETVEEIKKALNRNLEILDQIDFVQRIRLKFEKFRIMGNYLS
jgi:acetyl-CoA carboxylase alpha subunit